jgi:hypothetical protein
MCLPEAFWIWLGEVVKIIATGLPIIVGALLAYRFALKREFKTFKRNQLVKSCEEFSSATLQMTEALHMVCVYAQVFQAEKPSLQDVCSKCIDDERLKDGFVSAPTDKIAMTQGALALLDFEPIVLELKSLGDLFEKQFEPNQMKKMVNQRHIQNIREQIFQKRMMIIRMMRAEFN